jgi:uncharacterized alkaline shock family protein YloU
MAVDEETIRLECGVEVASLADQVAEDVPPAHPRHQATCRHCQTALAELSELWDEVRELARQDVAMPERMVRAVLEGARRQGRVPAELHLGEVVPRLVSHALLEGPRGITRIAEPVVAAVARRAALATPGVDSLSAARAGGLARAGFAVDLEGHSVRIQLGLVLRFGWAADQVAAQARARVIDAVEVLTGLWAERVDIVVADVAEGD